MIIIPQKKLSNQFYKTDVAVLALYLSPLNAFKRFVGRIVWELVVMPCQRTAVICHLKGIRDAMQRLNLDIRLLVIS